MGYLSMAEVWFVAFVFVLEERELGDGEDASVFHTLLPH